MNTRTVAFLPTYSQGRHVPAIVGLHGEVRFGFTAQSSSGDEVRKDSDEGAKHRRFG
jgi:hypothetical protein